MRKLLFGFLSLRVGSLLLALGLMLLSLDLALAVNYQVSGRVANAEGTVFLSATVEALDPLTEAAMGSATTDANGMYAFSLAEGTYHLRVTPPAGSGYEVSTVPNYVIDGNKVIDFTLVPINAVNVTGRVLDALGMLVAGKNVNLEQYIDYGDGMSWYNSVAWTSTNEDGIFTMTVTPGRYRLNLGGGGWLGAVPPDMNLLLTPDLIVSADLNVGDLTLPLKRVDVQVQSSDGSPVPNVQVRTSSSPYNANLVVGSYVATGRSSYGGINTDANGQVTMWLFPTNDTNTYTFQAEPQQGSGYGFTQLENIVITEDGAVTLTLVDAMNVTGRVLDALEMPVAGKNVNLEQYIDNGDGMTWYNSVAWTSTNEDGIFTMTVTPGRYRLNLGGGGWLGAVPPDMNLTLTPDLIVSDDDLNVGDLTLPLKRVDVQVQSPGGSPVPNVQVRTSSSPYNANLVVGSYVATGRSSYGGINTDANGQVTMWLFPTNDTNTYTFQAEPQQGSGYGFTQLENIVITEDGTVTLTLVDATNVTGRVLDALGMPVAGKNVNLEQYVDYGDGMSWYNSVAWTSTNEDGIFTMTVIPGRYRLNLGGGGWLGAVPPDMNLLLTPDLIVGVDDFNVGDLTLPLTRVDVQVQSPDGSPVPNVQVRTSSSPYNMNLIVGSYVATGRSSYGGVNTDSSGKATMWLFPTSGSDGYVLEIDPPYGTPFATFSISNFAFTGPKTEVVVLQYRQTGAISGRVIDAVGNPVVGAAVGICSGDACDTVLTNAQGEYASGELPVGQYQIEGFPPSGANLLSSRIGPFNLEADQDLVAPDLVLPAPALPAPETSLGPVLPGSSETPRVHWREDLTLTTQACSGGSASYEIRKDGAVYRSGALYEGAPGAYSATISQLYPLHGAVQIAINVACPDASREDEAFNVYIDPSGYVYDTQGTPLAGATVILYRSEYWSGPFLPVEHGSAVMSPSNRLNPDTTDAAGFFGWDVIAGFYKVRASKAGCVAPGNPAQSYVETATLTVPPPVTDLALVLDCITPPPPSDPPVLRIDDASLSAVGMLSLPIRVETNRQSVSSVAFTLNYDDACLNFSNDDLDLNGIPDAVTLNQSANFQLGTDTAHQGPGQIRIVVGPAEMSPVPTFGNGALVTVNFSVESTCTDTVFFNFVQNDASWGDSSGASMIGDVSDTATIKLNVPPVAGPDGATTNEDTPLTINLLANDLDADNDPLTISLDLSGLTGRIVENLDGVITYHPNQQFESLNSGESSVDSFSYTISDGRGGSATAIVSITVTGVNDAPNAVDDGYSTNEDSLLNVDAANGLFANDVDLDNDRAEFGISSVDTGSTLGTVTVNANGSFSYDPRGVAFFQALLPGDSPLIDIFEYTLSDGSATDSAVVTLNVSGVNDAPTASAAAVVPQGVGESFAFEIAYADVDTNDSHTYILTWGDGESANGAATSGRVVGNHSYATVGDYTISYNVADAGGLTAGSTTVVPVRKRGDCNNDSRVDAGDLPAEVLEIFDGDGRDWLDTPNRGFNGSPVGCDANKDQIVSAGDLSCQINLLLGRTCGVVARDAGEDAILRLGSVQAQAVGASVTLPVNLQSNGHAVAAAAFSLNLSGYTIDTADANGDGLFDAVALRVPGDVTAITQYSVDAQGDGKLDVVLFADDLTPFDGDLLSVTLTQASADAALDLNTLTHVSLGSVDGGSVPVQSGQAPTARFEIFLPFATR